MAKSMQLPILYPHKMKVPVDFNEDNLMDEIVEIEHNERKGLFYIITSAIKYVN